MEGCQWGGVWRRMGENVQGIRSINSRHREVKNSIGNGEAEELICTTHGHELRGGMLVGEGVEGSKGDKKMGQP